MNTMKLDEPGNLQPLAARGHVVSYMDWPALLGGALVAAALSALLSTFGVALGLSGVSAYAGKGMSAGALGIAAGLWVLWVGVSSIAAGAYLAGRMRHRSHDATEHESDIRDGVHGLVVWAIATLLAAYLATAAAGNAIKATTDAASGAAGAAMQMAGTTANPVAYFSDQLWRSSGTGTPAPAQGNIADLRQDAARILATSAANGSVSAGDKAYLAQQVATSTGLSKDEAAKRVDDVYAQINAAVAKARETAEAARRAGVLIAFLTAASLMVSAAAAWWAATMGGNHRDANIDISRLETWR